MTPLKFLGNKLEESIQIHREDDETDDELIMSDDEGGENIK